MKKPFALVTAVALAVGGWGMVGCEREPTEPAPPPAPTEPAPPADPMAPPPDQPMEPAPPPGEPGAEMDMDQDARPAAERDPGLEDEAVGPPQDDGPGGIYD